MINIFFKLYFKKMSFSSSPMCTPHDRRRRTMKKNSLQWKLMELVDVPNKMVNYFRWGPIFYVCSSERNSVSSM